MDSEPILSVKRSVSIDTLTGLVMAHWYEDGTSKQTFTTSKKMQKKLLVVTEIFKFLSMIYM